MSDTHPDPSNDDTKAEPAADDTSTSNGPQAEPPPTGASARFSSAMADINPGEWWAAILEALGILTRFAVPSTDPDDQIFLQAMRVFPLIGALVGAIGGLVFLLADVIDLSEIVGAALALAAILIVTRPPHAEALATLWSGGTPPAQGDESATDVMPAAATIALILIIVVELGVLAQVGAISPVRLLLLLIASGAVSRAVTVAALDWSTQDADDATTQTNFRPTIEAAILALIVGILCLFRDFDALIAGTVTAIIVGGAVALLGPPPAVSSIRRGYTVVQQSSELGFLVVAAAAITG
jgi:adenosylcobinamide-GDP ribazoletransferase